MFAYRITAVQPPVFLGVGLTGSAGVNSECSSKYGDLPLEQDSEFSKFQSQRAGRNLLKPQPLESFQKSFGVLANRERAIFALLLVARSALHLLDVIGLIGVGLLAAMLASQATGRTEASFVGVTIGLSDSRDFIRVLVLVALLFLTKTIAGSLLVRKTVKFLARVETRLSADIAKSQFSRNLSKLDGRSLGEINWLLSGSTQQAFSGVLYSFSTLVAESALFVLLFALFVAVDPITAIAVITYFGVLVGGYQFFVNNNLSSLGSSLAESSKSAIDSISDAYNVFGESSVKGSNGYFVGRFVMAKEANAIARANQRFYLGLPRYVLEAGLMIGLLVLIGLQFSRESLSEGLAISGVFLTGGLRMVSALVPIQNALTDLRTLGPQSSAAQRAAQDSQENSSSGSHTRAELRDQKFLTREQMGVSISNLWFRFSERDPWLLKGLNLDLDGGTFCALVGPSGSGKTTLSEIILGLRTPERGHVRIGGKEPSSFHSHPDRPLAYVPQHPKAVSGDLISNVALGIPDEEINRDRAIEILHLLGLGERLAESKMSKTSLLLSEELSGGELQRLGIARAIYQSPRLLILDEPTSALDADLEELVTGIVREMVPESTVLVVAHRLSTIERAQKVIMLEGGAVTGEGTYRELIKSNGRFSGFVAKSRRERH